MLKWVDDFNINFYQDLKAELTTAGLNDVFVRFDDGLFTDAYDIGRKFVNPVTNAMQDNQPEGSVWVLVRHLFSATSQPTIGTSALQHKREPFSFVCTIYNPADKSMKEAYQLSDAIDKTIFFADNVKDSDFTVRLNQVIPKNVTKPISKTEDIWQILRNDYNYTVDYCLF